MHIHRSLHHSIKLVSILCIPFSSHADHPDDDIFLDIPIVLSASRLEQPASETPMAVSTIDREIIDASGARNIPELLRLVPGMVVARTSNEFGYEPQYVISYHGHSDQYSRRMQVLIDGRSIYEPILGGVNWTMIPINMNDIERIEVIRGPNASSYGANSFLSVVNIITRHAAEDQGSFLETRAGNHDIGDVSLRYGTSNGDDIDMRFTLSAQSDDGQDRVDGIENHDGIRSGMLDYRIDYQIDDRESLTYQGGFGSTTQEVEENFAALGTRPQRDSENVTGYQFLKWENTVDDDDTFIVQYYLNYHDREDISISKPINPAALGFAGDVFNLLLDFSLNSKRHNLEFTHFRDHSPETRFIWGVSAQLDDISSPYFLSAGRSIERKTYRSFINIEHELDDANMIQLGTLYESNDFRGDSLSPRLSYIYHAGMHHSLRFNLSRAIRQPFVFESDADASFSHDLLSGGVPTGTTIFYQQFVSTPGLKTESILSRDIGYYASLLENQLNMNVRIFKDDLSDLIDAESIPGPPPHNIAIPSTTFTNQHDSTAQGFEIEVDHSLSTDSRLIASAAYIDIESANRFIIDSAPKRSASLMGIFRPADRLTLSFGLHHISDMAFTDVNNFTANGEDTGDYNILDLRINRRMKVSDYTADLSLNLRNLLDEYNGYDTNPGNGPALENNLTWYLELRMTAR